MTASAGKRRLKVLFFAQRFPYPMDTGGKIRTGKLLENLRHIFDITLISNVELPKDEPYVAQVDALCSKFRPVAWWEVKKYSWSFYFRILARLFSRYPIAVRNDYSRDLEACLTEEMRSDSYDVVICDFLQPSINFRNVPGRNTILFQHNVESMIIRRYMQNAKSSLVKVFWRVQWRKMCRYEREACRKFGAVITVSEEDKRVLENDFRASNVFAIPTGVDPEYFAPREEEEIPDSLVFTGSMDWLPNEDAILFFAQDILWRIKKDIPGVTLSVVGRNPSRSLLKGLSQYPEIHVVGRVDDIRPFVSRHMVYVIPLRIGGGTRIKAYEAMAMGKAVVSTPIGVEGLRVRDGEHLLVAEKAGEFASAVVKLLRDQAERARIASSARSFVDRNCSWGAVAASFADACFQVAGTETWPR